MKTFQDMVRDFNVAFNYPHSPAPIEIRDAELRANLVSEEPIETVVALVGPARAQTIVIGQLIKAVEKAAKCGQTGPSLVETIDGCLDSLVVLFGTLESIGLTAEETMALFAEVHRSNMAKVGGPVDPEPPDIEGVLRQIVEARIVAEQRGRCTCPVFCGGACF